MSCCCTNILKLCPTGTCEESVIDFGTQAKNDGIHKMVVTFLGVDYTIEQYFATGDQLKFPTKDLNENYTFTAQLFEPDGDKILIQKSGVNYDCFSFQTKLNYTIPNETIIPNAE